MTSILRYFVQRDILTLSSMILIVQSLSYFFSDFTPHNFYVGAVNIDCWGALFGVAAIVSCAGIFIKNYLHVRFMYLFIAAFSLLWGFGFILGLASANGDYRGLIGTALWFFVGYTNFREIDMPNPHLSDTFWTVPTSKT